MFIYKENSRMKKLFLLIFLFFPFLFFAQIKGTITDLKGIPLQFVSIYKENTYNRTYSNEQGNYELNIKKTGKHSIAFQYLGFKTQKITATIDKFPYLLNIKLVAENLSLTEVVINTKENPANADKASDYEQNGKFRKNSAFQSRFLFPWDF